MTEAPAKQPNPMFCQPAMGEYVGPDAISVAGNPPPVATGEAAGAFIRTQDFYQPFARINGGWIPGTPKPTYDLAMDQYKYNNRVQAIYVALIRIPLE